MVSQSGGIGDDVGVSDSRGLGLGENPIVYSRSMTELLRSTVSPVVRAMSVMMAASGGVSAPAAGGAIFIGRQRRDRQARVHSNVVVDTHTVAGAAEVAGVPLRFGRRR